VRNGRLDVLGANQLGYALYPELFRDPVRPVNHARYVFLDPGAPDFYWDWDTIADDTVAILRAEAGRNPYDRALTDLIGELSTRSVPFRTRWAAHNVRFHRSGIKRFHHPAVGDLELNYEAMELPADPGLRILTYSAEPGSSSADGLQLLAAWSATLEEEHRARNPTCERRRVTHSALPHRRAPRKGGTTWRSNRRSPARRAPPRCSAATCGST